MAQRDTLQNDYTIKLYDRIFTRGNSEGGEGRGGRREGERERGERGERDLEAHKPTVEKHSDILWPDFTPKPGASCVKLLLKYCMKISHDLCVFPTFIAAQVINSATVR